MLKSSIAGLLLTTALAFALPARAQQASTPVAALPWFTQAEFSATVIIPAPRRDIPSAPGTRGKGIRLAGPVALVDPLLRRDEGMISFWVRPDWNGDDGRGHRLLSIGDPTRNGLLVEKAASGMLRYVMASPEKVTAARWDVSGWRKGEWHHVAVSWFSREGKPIGLPLWIDRVAVDGPIAGGCTFLNPEAMPNRAVTVGDASSEATMDELIFRGRLDAEGPHGQIAEVYRDYFRTAPYDGVKVDPEPLRVPADHRAVAGQPKQLGALAHRNGRWEPITDYAVRYGQWAEFDAKPLLRWTSSDPEVAEVNPDGRVQAKRAGSCTISLALRDWRASYPLEVVPAELPDLGLICLELLPRYRSDALKDRPLAGETVTARVRLGNFGTVPLPAGAGVRLELVGVDPDEPSTCPLKPKSVKAFTASPDRPLAPGEEAAVEFPFTFPAKPLWMRVRLDPSNTIAELCEANNELAERTDARPIHMGYDPKVLAACLKERRMNHVGSFSYYDWLRAQKLRMDVMLREAVWPTTGPKGVEEYYRVDAMTALTSGNLDDQPYGKESVWFDGGFPVNEPVDLMAIDAAIIHEFGHTILSQPDLYGYPVQARNVLLTDGAGKPLADTPLLPVLDGSGTLALPSAINLPCGAAYSSLMVDCHLWLHPSQAGHIMHYRGYRPDRFWGTQGRLIPTRSNALLVTDLEDRPLKGAAVYVYGVANPPVNDSGAKYFADRPKFVGQTDSEGRFVFPGQTDEGWDDPDTDEVDGAVDVWNPFGRAKTDTAFTPNVWGVEGLLLLKIVSGDQMELQWLDLTQFNTEFLSGHTVSGLYPVRTSLNPATEPTPVVRRPVPEPVRKTNRRPVAVADPEVTVHCGQEYTLDGSRSHDPEGQPLLYRWSVDGDWLRTDGTQEAICRLKAPDSPTTLTYRFYVMDGVRSSEAVQVRVKVVR
ncbi:MAG TPA: Ig-like domain-containing protein [Armatimonadota bacterium]|jgi:hypothetical protein